MLSQSFSQDSLFGKYDRLVGQGTLSLNSDSTYHYLTEGCYYDNSQNSGFWTVKKDSLYTYRYPLNPISLAYNTTKIYTEVFWIDKKNKQLNLEIDNKTNQIMPFVLNTKPNLVYLNASINGFYRCHRKDILDFVKISDCKNYDVLYEVKSFKIKFIRDGKTIFNRTQKGNVFSKKKHQKYLKLKPGDQLKLSNFSITKSDTLMKHFEINKPVYTIR